MPRKILASQRTRFWNLRKAGHSIREASSRAGFSESYGKALVRNGLVGSNQGIDAETTHAEAEMAARPKHRWELSPVAADCLEDFGRFRHRYLGSVSTPWQIEAAHIVVDHLDSDDDSYGVINAPQGSGKTRLFSHDIPAWMTVRDRAIRGCLGSGTMRISESMTGNLRATLARTSPVTAADRWKRRGMAADAQATLQVDYGRFKPIMEGVKWTRPEFVVEQLWDIEPGMTAEQAIYRGSGQDKEATWAAFSYEAQVMSLRFDFMGWDDLHTSRQMRNPDVMADLQNWWDTEAESRLDPGGLCLLTMQRLGSNDISRYLLDKIDPDFEIDADRPDEQPRQYFHIRFQAHYDDRCRNEHAIDSPAYPDGCMLDPRRITWQRMNAKKVAGTFQVVFQQEDTDPDSALVRPEWIEGCWDHDRARGQLPARFPPAKRIVRYLSVDPSPTKYWALIDTIYVLPDDPGIEPTAGWRHVIDMHRGRLTASEFLDRDMSGHYSGLLEDWTVRAREQGHPYEWLIFEKNAAQRFILVLDYFRSWSATRGVEVLEHETMRNRNDSDYGIQALLPPVWRHGRIRLPGGDRAAREAVAPLIHEVSTWPEGATDDTVMAQWFGELHLANGTLIGPLATNQMPFYSETPSWISGGLTVAERRVAAMLNARS